MAARLSHHHNPVALVFGAVLQSHVRMGCARWLVFALSGLVPNKLFFHSRRLFFLFDFFFAAVPFAAIWQLLKILSLFLVSWTPPPKPLLWGFLQSRFQCSTSIINQKKDVKADLTQKACAELHVSARQAVPDSF